MIVVSFLVIVLSLVLTLLLLACWPALRKQVFAPFRAWAGLDEPRKPKL